MNAKGKVKFHKTLSEALRQISSKLSGLPNSSMEGKKYNQIMSANAYKYLLNSAKSFKDFHDVTINEHQMPISESYRYFCENSDKLSTDFIVQHFLDYPVVTILREEDKLLAKSKWSEDRYKNIQVLTIPDAPINYFD